LNILDGKNVEADLCVCSIIYVEKSKCSVSLRTRDTGHLEYLQFFSKMKEMGEANMKKYVHLNVIFALILLLFYQGSNNSNESDLFNGLALSASSESQSSVNNILLDEWFGFYLKGMKIGYLHSTICEQGSGYSGNSKGFMKISAGTGEAQETMLEDKILVDKQYRLISFNYRISSGNSAISMSGERSGDSLKVILDAGGSRKETIEKISGEIFSPLSLQLRFLKEGVKAGSKISYDIYFQPAKKVSKMIVQVGEEKVIDFMGRKEKAFPVTQVIEGMKSTLWVTADGRKLKEKSFEGFEIRSEMRDEAIDIKSGMNIYDMLKLASVKTDIKIKNPSKAVSAEFRFKDLSEGAEIPQRKGQNIKSVLPGTNWDTKDIAVEVIRDSLDDFKPLSLPVTYYRNYQKSTQFIQSGSLEIKKIANSLLKSSQNDSLLFVKEALRWMKENIKTTMTENFSALDTLVSGEGECQSHSYLFSAIIRAGSVPCRIVSGLVYSERFDAFMYHAWCEVFIGKWISVDPALRQFPADSTHIVLAEGDIFSQAKIINFLRNSGIKVLRVEYD